MAMMDVVKLYRDKGKDAWKRLNSRQRMVFGAIGAAIVLGFFLLVASFGSGGGGMVALKVPVSDPRAAIERLRLFAIKAELDGNENNVVVPKEKEDKAAMILASSGMLPNGKEVYGWLKEANLSQTDARMKEAARIDLQEMLADTISAMPFVSQAEVFLTPPMDRFYYAGYSKEESRAKASVNLWLRDQDALNDMQVKSIAQLVGNTYPSLSPETVVIVDQNGRSYNFDADSQQSADYWKVKMREERAMASKVESLLIKFKAHAEATVAIRADKEKTTSDILDPERRGPLPLVEENRKHTRNATKKAGSAGAEGSFGRDSSEDPANTTLQENEAEQESANRYDYSRTKIERLSETMIAIYDQSSISVTISDEHKDRFDTDEKLSTLRQFISKSTKVPVDEISVMLVPTISLGSGDGSGLSGLAATLLKPENLMRIVLLVLALGAFISLMLMLKKSAPKPLSLVDEETVEDQPEPMPEVPTLPPVEQLEGNLVREKVVELIKKNPSAAANLVKRWMIFGK